MRVLLVHTPFDIKYPLTTLPHLIRKVCGTFWNHCAFHDEQSSKSLILESEIHGVKDTPIRNWGRDQTLDVYEVPDHAKKDALKRAYGMIGKFLYGFTDLFIWMPLYLAFGVYWGRKTSDSTNRPTCYEYCGRSLRFPGWYHMTPKQFEKEMIDRGYKKLYGRIHISDYIKTLESGI